MAFIIIIVVVVAFALSLLLETEFSLVNQVFNMLLVVHIYLPTSTLPSINIIVQIMNWGVLIYAMDDTANIGLCKVSSLKGDRCILGGFHNFFIPGRMYNSNYSTIELKCKRYSNENQ